MDHTVNRAQVRQRLANIRFNKLKICIPRQMRNILSAARQEIIKAHHPMSLTQYKVAQMRRHDASRSGNKKAQKGSSKTIV